VSARARLRLPNADEAGHAGGVFAAELSPAGPLLLVLGFILLLCGLNAGRKRRLLDDTPLSKTLGVFIGEVEITGACVTTTPFQAYLSGRMCVLYDWSIEEEWERWETETYTDKDGRTRTRRVLRSGWTTVASNEHSQGFYLKDEFGFLWVHPRGAELEKLDLFFESASRHDDLYFAKGPSEEISDSTGQRRFRESGLPVGTQLFVRGRASERSDIVAPQIVQDPKAEMFIITPRKESEVSAGKNTTYWLCNVFGLIAVLAGCGFFFISLAHPAVLVLVAGYFLAWAAGWVWMVFNSLVGLRNRVRQGHSLIDVQLKRRADLIPPLVACLQGFRNHEAALQTTIATLRAQAGATRVSAVASSLLAVVENYPELKADQSFNRLMKHLTETEDRIALARAYANDITTFYNTRLERIPDAYVARIISMEPGTLFVATGFERKPVGV
jgi:hypothetical protein